ncbi:Starch-binding associating with outer membrane [bacterium A37T11]|nr:Starch-binding associating with outer membrane [bacterium A37T11]
MTFSACLNDLNVAPQNIIQDDQVFSNESAVNAYFASMYDALPIEDFNFLVGGGFGAQRGAYGTANITNESVTNSNDDHLGIGGGTSLGWWGYNSVRNVNDFIAKVALANFPAEIKSGWLGEAKFIRAYYYFGMVKRYGGIPLITEVQNFTGDNLDELMVPRNTEKEVYDFIATELDDAIKLLGKTSVTGRANKYVAFALKSRAMVYAAAESKYGMVQLNGLLGIDPASANQYWQAAYDAADSIITSGKYSLYNKSADKAENFTNLFLDADNPGNIFIKQFQYPDKAHSYDLFTLPHDVVGASIGYGSRINPTLELVSDYEYTDGTPGTLKLIDNAGNPIVFKDPTDLYKGKDPRLAATVLYPFSLWKGTAIEVRAGIVDGGKTITSGNYNDIYKGNHVIGHNGIGGHGEVSQTGYYVRKYLQPAYDRTTVKVSSSAQAFIDFRFAEILLNYAEAAAELNKIDDATSAINMVRNRAGIRALTASEVNINRIRHEKQVEFALEPFRYWDMRRWHIADQVMNNTKYTAILPYLDLDKDGYIFKTAPISFPKTFTPNMYYERIDPNEISKNAKLIQNPGY